ncbi:D-arabinono-1,4-lactone oxidase [Deinococcus lacus]|uniref:D-arabinono-1,4-lactone oxidase n=1 Tax=Deinococcus lacus TaxID=392561 RepID=A0ABW1YD78_9DEIO
MTATPSSSLFVSRSTRPTSGPVWRNWAGNVEAHPQQFLRPQTEAEVQNIIRDAARQGLKVRAVGSGHSFTPAAATDDFLVSLEHCSGVRGHDPATGHVTVGAGTHLYHLNGLLADLGVAQENMGDINKQSVAGAISTGTHGTGLTLGSVGTQVEKLRLIDGLGEVRVLEGETLGAGRLSLGALGIVTEVTLRTIPAYRLKMQIRAGTWAEMLHLAPEYAARHRHFEFFWIPYTDAVQVKETGETGEPAQQDGPLQVLNDVVLENMGVKLLCEVGRHFPAAVPTTCQMMGSLITPNTRIQASHDIFGSLRDVKFREMEYGLPIAAMSDALRDLRRLMERRQFPIALPVEVRFTRADDVWLSTAYGRDVVYIAIHAYQGVPCEGYFTGAEAIFRHYGGRPHWGKCHTLTAADFARELPRFGDFLRLRDELDPQRRFANPYLERVLGA